MSAIVMDLPSADINELRGNGFHIIYDHQQQQLRHTIESYRILPNNCTFSQLDETLQEDIKRHCRNYKAVCPSGNHNHKCTFRYIDNASISKILQPRYACKTCDRTFTLFGRSYIGAASKKSLKNRDQKCRSKGKKIKKSEDLAAGRYTTSGHDGKLAIGQPHTHKTMSTRNNRGRACCGRSQNQLYACRSQWSLDVPLSPLQHHNILSSYSCFNSESFLSSLYFVSDENYDQHMLQQDMKGAHASYPSIFSADLIQRSYRPFESVNEFGISLQENNINDTRDEMGIALRNIMTEQANNYEYSPHDVSVFPTSLSTSCETCRENPPTYQQTQFQGYVPGGGNRGGKYCDQVEILEMQSKDYSTGYQNGNVNFSACLPFSSCPPCLSNGELSTTNQKDLYLSTTVAVDYLIHPNSDKINYQNHAPAYVRGGCEEMIKEYTQKADYGSKDGENGIADLCASIFDLDQSKLLNEILPKTMKSAYEDSCSVSLDELIDIDDIIIDSPLHASNPINNNIEAPQDVDSDGFKNNINDESKGFEQVVRAKKADEIEIVISSTMDPVQSFSVENFEYETMIMNSQKAL